MKVENKFKLFKITPARMLAISFLALILLGALLLWLPFSTKAEGCCTFIEAFFIATSATCVTGFTLAETVNTFTLFGQIVILFLIQIGGLGFITIISLFMLTLKKDVTLSERKIFLQSAGGMRLADIKKQVIYIVIGTFAIEFIGAIFLSTSFIRDYGWAHGIWYSIFTAISAFCNAGFALTTNSLMGYATDVVVSVTVMLLIIIGGIGFFVWGDVVKNKHHFSKYSLHTKLVLITTGILILGGWLVVLVLEWNNPETIADLDVGGKLLTTLFLSVTSRTAGFYSMNLAGLNDGTSAFIMFLMCIGGSSGSTAGGIKTTTIAVLAIAAVATFRRKEETSIFKRKFDGEQIFQASAIVMLYFVAVVTSAIFISAIENSNTVTFEQLFFEVFSAASTVGLSMGITSQLSSYSLLILSALMFYGRVGGYTLVLVFAESSKPVKISHISEQIMIG
ncbi:MAG: Trk family potassium uptake protein [Clostridiales bacterium]|nr:Trk family potassium uptake protein [Clostridiales bacterium]